MHELHYQGWIRGLRPIDDERAAAPTRVVSGRIPDDLAGTLYRCGPSQRILPPEGSAGLHLFDGDGLLQKLSFEDGKLSHASRFVRTASYVLEQRSGTFNQHCLGTRAHAPVRGIRMRQQQNTNVVAHGGRLLALVESAAPVAVDFDSLERLGEHDFGFALQGRPLSAHPKRDARTGELFIHGCFPLAPYLQLHCVDRAGAAIWRSDLELARPSWIHDIALTEHYVIFPASPVSLRVSQIDGQWIPTDPYAVDEHDVLHWLVCSRRDGKLVARIDSDDACLVVHVGAAREDGHALIIDAVTYDRPAAYLRWLKVVRAGGWEPGAYARYARHCLRLDTLQSTCTSLITRSCEFPTASDQTSGQRSRYTYLALGALPASSPRPAVWNSIGKLDTDSGALTEHQLEGHVSTGESVFAPRARASSEDDGYLLSVTYDAGADRSRLLILDARDLRVVALVELELRVPFSFHGSFVPFERPSTQVQ